MERKKNKPMWVLFLVLLCIFLIGIASEAALKYVFIRLTSHPADPSNVITNRMLRAFGDETLPIWAVPILLLYWLPLMPRELVPYALRWLPYLIMLLLPAFCALMRKKQIPLILCAIGAGFVSVGLVLVRLFSRQPYSNVIYAIPFGIECLLLVFACIAIGAKKKGFAITLGVFSLLLALLSPAASALLSGLGYSGLPKGYPIDAYIFSQLRQMPMSCATSQWPLIKSFAFLMYALVLFAAPKRFVKREKPVIAEAERPVPPQPEPPQAVVTEPAAEPNED